MQIGLNEHQVVSRRRTFAPQAVSLVPYALIFHFFQEWKKLAQIGLNEHEVVTRRRTFVRRVVSLVRYVLIFPIPT